MLFFLDTANVKEIARSFDLFPISGVSTNPTLIAKEKRPLYDILSYIRKVIGENSILHVQVLGADADTMVAEARQLRDQFGASIYPKIPVTPRDSRPSVFWLNGASPSRRRPSLRRYRHCWRQELEPLIAHLS
jgi:transaldolase